MLSFGKNVQNYMNFEKNVYLQNKEQCFTAIYVLHK